jgi:hypothetical protein
MKGAIFWDVMLNSLAEVYGRFERTHLHGRGISRARKQQEDKL